MHLQGRQLQQNGSLTSQLGYTLKVKKSNFFPFRIGPFSEGGAAVQEVPKVYPFEQNSRKSTECIHSFQLYIDISEEKIKKIKYPVESY